MATTATPAGICTTSITPGTDFAAAASNEATVPPNRGGRLTSATRIPGNATSMVNCAVPLVFGGTSTRGSFDPIRVKSLRSFNGALSGAGTLAACVARAPNEASRLLAPWRTTPRSIVISLAGAPHCAAAAAISIARPMAPASRICIHELGMALLPPVPCILKARLA